MLEGEDESIIDFEFSNFISHVFDSCESNRVDIMKYLSKFLLKEAVFYEEEAKDYDS